jgi:hypothetical protein
MKTTIIITKVLDDAFAPAEELDLLTDEEIIGIAREDVCSLLAGATWEIRRIRFASQERSKR